MVENNRKIADEWFERGRHDLEMAKLIYDSKGYTDTIVFLVQQSIEKYLKGYLVLHGKIPKKTHDLELLLDEVSEFLDEGERYVDLCIKVSRYYIESRYPPGPPIKYSFEEIKKDLDKTGELVKILTGD